MNNTINKNNGFYLSVKTKFFISILISILWVIFSYEVSKLWLNELSSITTPLIAFIIIAGVAYVPGFMNAFLVGSLILDKQPKLKVLDPRDEVTLLISAYNEEIGIFETLRYVKNQENSYDSYR